MWDCTISYEDLFVLQLVPAVTELVIAQFMYLQWLDPKEPIYIYINSTGTTRDDGETVSLSIVKFVHFPALSDISTTLNC